MHAGRNNLSQTALAFWSGALLRRQFADGPVEEAGRQFPNSQAGIKAAPERRAARGKRVEVGGQDKGWQT